MLRDPQDTFGCGYRLVLCIARTLLITVQVMVRSLLHTCTQKANTGFDGDHRISPLVYDTIMCSLAVYRGVTMYKEDLGRGKKLITVIIR